jgi:hypothetical protein
MSITKAKRKSQAHTVHRGKSGAARIDGRRRSAFLSPSRFTLLEIHERQPLLPGGDVPERPPATDDRRIATNSSWRRVGFEHDDHHLNGNTPVPLATGRSAG